MEAIPFFKEPVADDRVKVYTGEQDRYGKVTGITNGHVYDENVRKVVFRQVLQLDECDFIPFNRLDYILPIQKVKFNNKKP